MGKRKVEYRMRREQKHDKEWQDERNKRKEKKKHREE
jgi:hypothetical protein